jgi:O-antigen ligase
MRHSATLPTPRPRRRRTHFLGLTALDWAGLASALLVALVVGYLVGTGRVQAGLAIAVGIPLVALVAYSPPTGLMLWFVIAPFFVQSETAEATPMGWLLWRLALPGMLTLVAVYALLGLRNIRLRLGAIDVMLVVFVGYGIASSVLLTPNPERSLVSFYGALLMPITLFWLIRSADLREIDVRRLAVVGAITIGIQVVVGMASWVAPGILPDHWLTRAGERTTGTFGGPGPFSVTIVFFALLLLHVVLRDRPSPLRRAVYLALIAAGLFAVFMTLSRGSWLGAAIVILGIAVVFPRIALRLILAGALLGGGVGYLVLGEPLGTAQERFEDADTVADRLITNQAAISMIVDRPAFGFGFGNFERFDEQYKERVGDIPLKTGGTSHNTYLNFAVEMGAFGFALYFGVPLILLVRTIASWERLPRDGLLSRWLVFFCWLAVLDQFAVSNFLEMVHGNTWGTMMWWTALGLIAVVLDHPRRDDGEERVEPASGGP